tara:strand:- start:7536 stop:8012 length:477 start_codon:yes stop_codon:yes gene_type:complete
MDDFKKINNYNNYYINKIGQVKNINTNRILKTRPNSSGYLMIDLCNKGKRQTITIHKLVLNTFVEKKNLNFNQIDHINKNKHDNRLENLRYIDSSGNNRNKKLRNKHGYIGVYKRNNKFCSNIRKEHGKRVYLGIYDTAQEAGQAYLTAYNEIMKQYD